MYKSAPAMTIDANKTYVATIKTSKGDIVVELYPKDAPKHVNNFVFLARDGFFNGLTFHRVVPGFVIQGGDPLGTGTGGPGYNIPPELKAKHSEGAIAMARQGGPAQTTPSSGSQFYITLAPQPGLDGDYTVFGQTTQGMDVVKKIAVGDVIQSVAIEEK
jgi:cyclophilin family peptidyl-prolyl cis-trans isomerase